MSLKTPRMFFESVTSVLGSLDQGEVDGSNAILTAMDGAPLAYTAYAMATAFLETGHTMKPVLEANWLTTGQRERYCFRMYDIAGARPDKAKEIGNNCSGDGVKFCGMGYVQMTGRKNFTKAAAKLGVDLVEHPEKAMDPGVAAKIMRAGMDEGWFTGKSFGSYLPSKGRADITAFKQARRIINGQDRAGDIAGFGMKFQSALEAGGWA